MIRYPAYFTDGEAESRARIEHLLTAKSGRGREYHFTWDEEANHLCVDVLAALPTDIAAQRFVTAPGETVLGFTDPTRVQRTLPLTHGVEQRDVPPVVWRTGIRSTEPHLLVLGQPGTGTSTLLRSVALQALHHGDLLIVDGGGTGEYACRVGRDGVLAVECGLTGALTSLEWAAAETGAAADLPSTRPASRVWPHRTTPGDPCGSSWTVRPRSRTSPPRAAAGTRRPCSRSRCGTAGPRT
ncbi:hypothetical protein STENM327S_08085 [Streptomyces tendae]